MRTACTPSYSTSSSVQSHLVSIACALSRIRTCARYIVIYAEGSELQCIHVQGNGMSVPSLQEFTDY